MRKCKACGLQFYTTDPTKELCHCCTEALQRLNGYAVPVAYGRWIMETDMDEDWGEMDYYKCSVCNKGQLGETNYCPHCGAKMMDGGNEDG